MKVRDFRVGDLVECVYPATLPSHNILLTSGGLYEIVDIRGGYVKIKGQLVIDQWFHLYRFRLSKFELREEILNQLGI